VSEFYNKIQFVNIRDENLYYIGGVVRDEILGAKSFDTDLTYQGNAVEFVKNIKDAKILQINESFGTVRIDLNGEETDIASTRYESYPQKGHLPVVEKIGCSLKEDVMRRDFTINALAKSTLTGEIIDYTGGLNDIKAKWIRVLHDESFRDDPTRIVRALKFAVRFGFELEEHTKKLQEDYLSAINYDMSYKRLKKELVETFNLNSRNAFERFVKQGIYKLVSPQNFELPSYDFSGLIKKYSPEIVWIIYVGLLDDTSNLPLTRTESKIVEDFRDLKGFVPKSDFEIYKKFQDLRPETIIMYSVISLEIAEKYLENLRGIRLEINGSNLQNLGIKPCEKYQKCFDFILEKKILNPAMNLYDELELAKVFFNIV